MDARPILERLAARLCASSADAADLVQDTLERAIRVGLPVDVQSPRAWLTTMLHNLFVDRCRAAVRKPPHELLDETHETHDNVTRLDADEPEPLWSRATLDDLHAALEQIHPTSREVYVLHSFERRSY
ncbi:MAG TPA: RNA polymerase sigma factor, partial [Kofleriaceae bacterium]|nr:RNA polymerase sigma factor [Kofleriaceae bacterium]